MQQLQEMLEESKTPMNNRIDGNIERGDPVFPPDIDEIRDKVRELA